MSSSLLYKGFGHYWTYCNHCKRDVVICGICGNNCCNACYGQVEGKTCEACPSAYDMQTHRTSDNSITANKQERLEIDTGFK